MKNLKNVILMLFAILFSSNLIASSKGDETSSFKVYGNCEMCKARIEKALMKNKNVKKANWDVKTKKLTVTYDSSKITLDELHKTVAHVGHDTDKVKANDAIYHKLDGCCQSERAK